ncbi:MAG: hypothetical protein LBG89_03270 [Rickettsiales bacterium]|jgi:GTPase SAR1 family protein|nr:hypothetical protein [Rickettsiales bacterium]
MKNLMIIGPVRCGKTTLANMLCEKFRFNYVSQDALVTTFQNIAPQLEIKDRWDYPTHNNKHRETLAPFMFEYMKRLVDKYEHGTAKHLWLVEGAHIGVRTAHKLIDHKNWDIVVLGYPNLDAENALRAVRENDTEHDWTRDESDEDLLKYLAEGAEQSAQYRLAAAELGLTFIDTGSDRKRKLQEFLQNLS